MLHSSSYGAIRTERKNCTICESGDDLKKKRAIILYAIMYLAFFLLSCYIHSRADDFVFAAGPERYGGLIGWAAFFTQNWSGRIIPQGLLVLILQMPEIFFHLVDALAWVILLIYIKRIFDAEGVLPSAFVYVAVSVMIFGLIPAGVLHGSIFWKCANVLYLWGSAAILIGICPLVALYHGRDNTRSDYILSAIATVYVSSFEQGGALLCGLSLLLLVFAAFDGRRVSWQIVALFVLAMACTFYFSTLPGNAARYRIEVLGHMPMYDMLTTVDKAIMGVWYAITGIERDVVFLPLLLAGTVTFVLKKTRKSKGQRGLLAGAYVMLGYFLLCALDHIGRTSAESAGFVSTLFELVQVDATLFSVPLSLAVKSILHFLAYVYLGCCVMLVDPQRFRTVDFAFYIGALGSMWIMGFSPTVYASGARPRFIGYLFLICVEISLVSLAVSGVAKDICLPDARYDGPGAPNEEVKKA